jgi:uncharacterized membrane protein
MSFVTEFLMKSGFSDLFVFACISFFISKHVMAQDWHGEGMNQLRNATSIAFYIFAVCLLIIVLATLPQCHGPNKQIKPGSNSPEPEQKDGSTK